MRNKINFEKTNNVVIDAERLPEEIDLRDFAQYLQDVSFDEALHRVRRISWDSILASEFLITEEPRTKTVSTKQAMIL